MMEIDTRLLDLRKKLKQSVILECSTSPEEWLCTAGHHIRGLWMKSHQTKGDTADEALSKMEDHAGV